MDRSVPRPSTDECRRQKYRIGGDEGLRDSLLQGIHVEISLGRKSRADDARFEGPHEASNPTRSFGVVRGEIRLHAESRHVNCARSAKEQRQTRADHGICPGGPEGFLNPIADRRDELYGRLGSDGTTIKVDREHNAARSQRRYVMSEDVDCVGKVKEDQTADDRVKGLSVLECPHVGLNECDVVDAGREPAMLGDLQQTRALVDAHHRAFLPHKVRHVKRDVTKTCAKIEHPHPWRDSPAGLQQQARRGRRHGRLGIQARDFGFIAAEYIRRLLGHNTRCYGGPRVAAASIESRRS